MDIRYAPTTTRALIAALRLQRGYEQGDHPATNDEIIEWLDDLIEQALSNGADLVNDDPDAREFHERLLAGPSDLDPIEPAHFTEILRSRYGEAAEQWHTGGGVWNPVLVLERNSAGEAIHYVMFSCGWHPDEWSFSRYDERQNDNGWEEPAQDYGLGDRSELPMDRAGILALIAEQIGDRAPATRAGPAGPLFVAP